MVDQLLFGWRPGQGYDVVAASISDPQTWVDRLRPHVRLYGFEHIPPPADALSYLVFPDHTAAVVRRFNDGPTVGLGTTHALVGQQSDLTPETALGLANWAGWLQADPLTPATLPDGVVAPAQEAIRRVQPRLAALTRTTPITIVGCPEDDKIPLLWCLRPRSFTTHHHTPEAGVDVVFLPEG
ncbi:hypothetical protein [Actinokineospora terrae]|uniref:Uncharacterized protein n=1 Tax=Actinokineospora terrae TaxID=155974 RepID=A0A1H9WRU4_9PSEU|nr:hypothetical protein [Actinokineospora terrae]SES36605.1 hypothetical protein SAMN04487818_111139 [Actinokineospora terrae]